MVSTILTQYHVSKGFKIYGEKGVDAVLKELQQLHNRMVIEPPFFKYMSPKQKEDALQYLMFLKQKTLQKNKRSRMHQWEETKGVYR